MPPPANPPSRVCSFFHHSRIVVIALSALLFIATVALWDRSYYISDDLYYVVSTKPAIHHEFGFHRGYLYYTGEPSLLTKYQRTHDLRGQYAQTQTPGWHLASIPNDVKEQYLGPYFPWTPSQRHFPAVDFKIETSGLDLPGFRFGYLNTIFGTYLQIHLPLAVICLLFASPPALLAASTFRRHFRHRRYLSDALCPTCSYNLRAHTPGQNCPECDTLFPTRPPEKSV